MPSQTITNNSVATDSSDKRLNAIEYLEGTTVKVTLRDNTTMQAYLERIGWMNADSEAISYLCLRIDAESNYNLAAQGISTKSGILFLPWDWVAYIVVP